MDVVDRFLKEFDSIPEWIVLIILVLLIVDKVSPGASKVAQFAAAIFGLSQKFRHRPRTEEQKQWVRSHKMFAEALEKRLNILDISEDWRDNRYAELDVEVEAEGRQRFLGLFSRLVRPAEGLRREQSLTRALEHSRERLILLEGEPGSGKSIALRHVAQVNLQRAVKAKGTNIVIPLYINLKEIEQYDQPIDAKLIRDFVLTVLRRSTTSDVDKFIDERYEDGVQNGTWFFLFDSFDEIPEVLSSTEVDPVLESYANALSRFFELNGCRGVVASRTFRSPRGFGWPTFRIVPLSERRKATLIRKAIVQSEVEQLLASRLPTAELGIRKLSSNPLFLGLLCEYMAEGQEFSNSVHAVFDAYVKRRIAKYEPYIEHNFGMTGQDVRGIAEQLAFCMAGVGRLGLSPRRKELQEAMAELDFPSGKEVALAMDALQYIRLARSEGEAVPTSQRSFTFAHRRFQEYFATCLVLADVRKVSARDLLTDGRWRETAVSILQLQPITTAGPLLDEAASLLAEATKGIPPLSALDSKEPSLSLGDPSTGPFSWPENALHVLGILDSGLASKGEPLPAALESHAAQLLVTAWSSGQTYDRKWVLEVAGTAPLPVRRWLISQAFQGRSEWLKETAYIQTSRLASVPTDIASAIRRALVSMCGGGRLRRDKLSVVAPIRRLEQEQDFLRVVTLLLLAPILDGLGHIALLIAAGLFSLGSIAFIGGLLVVTFAIVSHSTFYLVRASPVFSWHWSGGRFAAVARDLGGSAIGMFIYVRSFFLLTIVGNMTSSTGPAFVAFAVGGYLLTWGIAALVSASNGRMTASWQLPFVHIELLRVSLRAAWNARRQITWRGVLKAVGLLMAGLVMLSIGAVLIVLLPIVGLATALALIVVFIVIAIRTASRTWYHDWRWYQTWSKSRMPKMKGAQLLQCFDSLRTVNGIVRVLRDVQRRRLLIEEEEARRLLQDAARFLEAGSDSQSGATPDGKRKTSRRRKANRDPEPDAKGYGTLEWQSGVFAEWIAAKSAKERVRLQTLVRDQSGDKLIDELGRMVEQLRSKATA